MIHLETASEEYRERGFAELFSRMFSDCSSVVNRVGFEAITDDVKRLDNRVLACLANLALLLIVIESDNNRIIIQEKPGPEAI